LDLDMLASILIELAPAEDGGGCFTGHHVLSWFLEEIQRLDPVTSTALHASRRHKPFTIWAGPRFALTRHGVAHDESDPLLWVRLSALNASVSGLLARLAASLPGVVRLGGRCFSPIQVLTSARQHPWCDTSTFQELQAFWAGAPASGRVRLRFLSPTAFAGRDAATGRHAQAVFPFGALVFASLARRWEEHAPAPLPEGMRDALPRAIREESYDLRTTVVDLGTHRLKAFVGECEYAVAPDASDVLQRAVHMLADYAFYSGVGTKTTMGFGQALCEAHVL
jgi:CRISPR-associated endoribonuclease Cas6